MPKSNRLIVVIHALTGKGALEHVLSSAKIALENGGDGVMLISDYEKGPDRMAFGSDLSIYFSEVKSAFPGLATGVNFLLKQGAEKYLHLNKSAFDLFQTDGMLPSRFDTSLYPATTFFCGVAFKYGPHEHLRGADLKPLCDVFAKYPQNVVATTSGSKTGVPANMDKIRSLREYLDSARRIGIASGVTAENAAEFAECGINDFLVATSLRDHIDPRGFDILSAKKVTALANVIHKQ